MEFFKNGDRVEVSSNEPGFAGSYYEGRTVELNWARNAHMVCYKEFLKKDKSGPLTEPTDCSEIRPYPPNVEVELEVGDIVDAYANDGWWVGVLIEIRHEVGYVRFDLYDGMIVKYPLSNIRIHLDWEYGEWSVTSLKVREKIKRVEFEEH